MNKTLRIFQLIRFLRQDALAMTEIIRRFSKDFDVSLSKESVYRYIATIRKMGYQIECKQRKYQLTAEPEHGDCIGQFFDRKAVPLNATFLRKLREAMKYSLPVQLKYKSPRHNDIITLNVRLMDMAFIKDRPYLLGLDKQDKVIKEFRLDRICDLKLGCNRDTRMIPLLPIIFQVNPALSAYFDCPFKVCEKKTLQNGKIYFEAEVHSYFRAKRMLLEYLDQVEVLGPEEFRKDFVQTIKKIVKIYDKN